MTKLKPILLIALVFFAGIAVGVVGTKFVVRYLMEKALSNPDLVREKIERELTAELNLTPEQRTHVHKVLERSHDEVRKLRIELQPRLNLTMRQAEMEIAATLTPEQKVKFEKLAREKKMLWRPPIPFGGKPPFPRGDRPEPMGERKRGP